MKGEQKPTGVKPVTTTGQADVRLLKEFNQRYRKVIAGYFSKRVDNTADVDDLVQEVFLRLTGRANLSRIDQIGAYIFTTAANVLRDHFRRIGSRQTDCHDSLDDHVESGKDSSDVFSPERVLLGREALEKLITALEELPDRTRQIYLLSRFERLKYPEIAKRVGLSVRGVRFHMVKAKAHMAKCMELSKQC